jgi:hypothetical protein
MADLDLKGMAQLLRSKGRGRDTVLAHITPREAALLKSRGGSGAPNPETGLPEFQGGEGDVGAFDYGGAESFGESAAAMPAQDASNVFFNEGETYVPSGGATVEPSLGSAATSALENLRAQGFGREPSGAAPSVAPQAAPAPTPAELTDPLAQERAQAGAATGLPQPPEPGFLERLGTAAGKQLEDPAVLARLGLGLGVGGLGAFQQMRGAEAAKRARNEMAALGAPYRAQGQELIDQARRGELSPASAQAYQAAQARMAQQQARTGGVGVMQGAANLERLRSQLLQNQYQLGLNVANIGNQYLRGAIQSGLQADQALRTATNQFYSMLGNVLAGPTGQAVGAAARGI